MQSCQYQARQVYSAKFFVTVSLDSIASSHGEDRKTHCSNLGAPFIMQFPPFKAVLRNTIPNVDVLSDLPMLETMVADSVIFRIFAG